MVDERRERRRQHVDRVIEAYRVLSDRLRDVPLPAARHEREVLERKLVQLRAERALLVGRTPQAVLRGLGRTLEPPARDEDPEDERKE